MGIEGQPGRTQQPAEIRIRGPTPSPFRRQGRS
jgi:hypothetical protein